MLRKRHPSGLSQQELNRFYELARQYLEPASAPELLGPKGVSNGRSQRALLLARDGMDNDLLADCEAFRRTHNMTVTGFSKSAAGRPTFLQRLRQTGYVGPEIVARVRRFMCEYGKPSGPSKAPDESGNNG